MSTDQPTLNQQEELAKAVKKLAADCGYVACGITSAEPFTEDHEAVLQRISKFPEAKELYERYLRRTDPKGTAPWCNSVIACVRWYGKYKIPEKLIGYIARHYLGDCRLEICPDYPMAGKMTAGLRELGLKCKKGGVPDRWAGVRAGVVGFGKNCSVYAPGYGSWINIQTWRVDAELPVDKPTAKSPCPEGCQICAKACPTKAITDDFCLRMDRCIAYLSYTAPFPIEQELWDKMGSWVYGCDICQQVCPLNKDKWQRLEPVPWIDEVADLLTPETLAQMDEATYLEKIHPLLWYIPATDLARWHANAKRALENKP